MNVDLEEKLCPIGGESSMKYESCHRGLEGLNWERFDPILSVHFASMLTGSLRSAHM